MISHEVLSMLVAERHKMLREDAEAHRRIRQARAVAARKPLRVRSLIPRFAVWPARDPGRSPRVARGADAVPTAGRDISTQRLAHFGQQR